MLPADQRKAKIAKKTEVTKTIAAQRELFEPPVEKKEEVKPEKVAVKKPKRKRLRGRYG